MKFEIFDEKFKIKSKIGPAVVIRAAGNPPALTPGQYLDVFVCLPIDSVQSYFGVFLA